MCCCWPKRRRFWQGISTENRKCLGRLLGNADLEMVMVKDVKVGAEVFNTYGLLGNAALLHRYGFTEPDNPFDIVNIDLELVLQWSASLNLRKRKE